MTLLLIAYLGGALTILSPCILPILPFVFARAGRPFVRSTLPMLIGLAATFALVATLAAVGGGWAVQANQYGRNIALCLVALFGVTLLLPRVADTLSRPAVSIGNRLLASADDNASTSSWRGSLTLGVAIGFLWAPCAGPILGLVLTGTALRGANIETTLLLTAYAAGAATSLAIALFIGSRIFATLKRSLGAGQWLRRGLGIAVLTGVAIIALGADTGFLLRLSSPTTVKTEQALLDAFTMAGLKPDATILASDGAIKPASDGQRAYRSDLPVEGVFPALDGAVTWLNSPPLTPAQLRGKVVLVNFWTYSCINCIRTLPYVRAWSEKYKDQGLVVIGVHTPEFAFEKEIGNIKNAIGNFEIDYPVAVDSNFQIWRAFGNEYWPAQYLIDASGLIRYHHFGEGEYDVSEKAIQDLLAESGKRMAANTDVALHAEGIEAAPDLNDIRSSETYIGYQQATNFASPEGIRTDIAQSYTTGKPGLNEWSLDGTWTVGAERATLNQPGGGITYRFSARDLHLVLGPTADGKPVRFQVTVDGKVPAENHGADTDAAGDGTVTQTRLYQLVRQTGEVKERVFAIRFLDPGAQAFVFTFG